MDVMDLGVGYFPERGKLFDDSPESSAQAGCRDGSGGGGTAAQRDEADHLSAGPSWIRAKRAGNWPIIRFRSSGFRTIHFPISSVVRPQPTHMPPLASSWQTLMQGEATGLVIMAFRGRRFCCRRWNRVGGRLASRKLSGLGFKPTWARDGGDSSPDPAAASVGSTAMVNIGQVIRSNCSASLAPAPSSMGASWARSFCPNATSRQRRRRVISLTCSSTAIPRTGLWPRRIAPSPPWVSSPRSGW